MCTLPTIQVINKDVKTGLASVLTSGSDLPPSGLCDSDYSPFSLPFQPIFNPTLYLTHTLHEVELPFVVSPES